MRACYLWLCCQMLHRKLHSHMLVMKARLQIESCLQCDCSLYVLKMLSSLRLTCVSFSPCFSGFCYNLYSVSDLQLSPVLPHSSNLNMLTNTIHLVDDTHLHKTCAEDDKWLKHTVVRQVSGSTAMQLGRYHSLVERACETDIHALHIPETLFASVERIEGLLQQRRSFRLQFVWGFFCYCNLPLHQ